jgi:hypothetical protein
MSFYLVRLDPDGEKPLPDYGPYDLGPEAAKQAKALSEQLGVKVQPRRIRQAPDWKARQLARLQSGELMPLPPEWDLAPIPDHFAHLSKKNLRLIAFTESEEKGIIDRVTVMKPGVYLARFYPDLADPFDPVALKKTLGRRPTEEDIAAEWQRLRENARKRYAGMIAKGEGVEFATTPDEIEWVYENMTEDPKSMVGVDGEVDAHEKSVTSCMTRAYQRRNGRDDFESSIHPVCVYGAGDLAVAYTTGKSGKVAERCICWPDKKIHGRIYSDGSGRLKKLLEDEGYKAFSGTEFDGARLLRVLERIEDDEGDWKFVCPHIDAGITLGCGTVKVIDDGDYLRITSNTRDRMSMDTGYTTGVIPAKICPAKRKAAA